jgi:hypothetical protein
MPIIQKPKNTGQIAFTGTALCDEGKSPRKVDMICICLESFRPLQFKTELYGTGSISSSFINVIECEVMVL